MALVIIVPFLILTYFLFVVGTATISKQLSSGFTGWLRDAGVVGRFIGGVSADIAVRLTRWITHQVGEVFVDAERLAVAWFSGLYQWAALAVGQALLWPIELFKLQWWLVTKAIPDAIHAALRGVHGAVTTVTKVLPGITRTIVKLPKLTKAQAKALVGAAVATYIHPFLADLTWLRRHFHALTAVLPRALPIPQFPTFPNIWKRLRALERKIGVPVALGVVATALARLGLGWIRCNKVKRVGKGVCGLDDSLIDKFLLDALAIFGVISIVEFAEGLLAIEDEAVGIMGHLVREWPT
jgi:hypothetical protein